MERSDWTVGSFGVRPAGPPDRCFYCDAKVGEQHKLECVIRQRTVVVDVNIRMVLSVPEHWEPYDIEHHYNESSSCADNLMNAIEKHRRRLHRCMCGDVQVAYVEEASKSDEEWYETYVSEEES